MAREYHIKSSVTEPYSPWQNKAEREFGKVRSLTRNFMDTHEVPSCLGDYAQEHNVEVHNHTTWKALHWLTPYEAETGDMPDCSHLLYFNLYQPVWYWDNLQAKFPKQKHKLGCWLGIACNAGQALCYHILVPTGAVIARSTVKAVDEDTTDVGKTIEDFDAGIHNILCKNDVVQCESAADQAKATHKFRTDNDDVSRNCHIMYEMYTEDDTEIESGLTMDDFHDTPPVSDTGNTDASTGDITGVTVMLSHDGTMQAAMVKGWRRDSDGNAVKDILGDEQYIVQFSDGTQVVHQYKALVDAVYIQFDANREEWYTFTNIIAHEKHARGG